MKEFPRWIWIALSVVLLLAHDSKAQFSLTAQEKQQETESLDIEALRVERDEVLAQIGLVEAKRLPPDGKNPVEAPTVTEELALLNRLSFVLDQILKLQPDLEEVEDEKIRIGRELAESNRSVRVLDALRDELNLDADGKDILEVALETAQGALERSCKPRTRARKTVPSSQRSTATTH